MSSLAMWVRSGLVAWLKGIHVPTTPDEPLVW
jgi:hypothetical protein